MSSEEQEESTENKIARFEQYCATMMELDKSFLTLSTAGMGFSAAFLLDGKATDTLTFFLLGGSSLFFGVAIVLLLFVFKFNGDYMILSGEEVDKLEKLEERMKLTDRSVKIVFGTAVLLLCSSVLIISYGKLASSSIPPTSIEEKNEYRQNTKPEQGSAREKDGSNSIPSKQFKGSESNSEGSEGSNEIPAPGQDGEIKESDEPSNTHTPDEEELPKATSFQGAREIFRNSNKQAQPSQQDESK
ncbi:hypothetical protein JCM19235_3304 [Vibrio maritimus]|uniref:Uncharacterized protein n=1 Tax=Vibrio maritimus TaxID=990268 RepID=A0A090S7Q3_9VIBR|nr:hypothetical protein JCM19235_3304 [Vibrio maritimus]